MDIKNTISKSAIIEAAYLSGFEPDNICNKKELYNSAINYLNNLIWDMD